MNNFITVQTLYFVMVEAEKRLILHVWAKSSIFIYKLNVLIVICTFSEGNNNLHNIRGVVHRHGPLKHLHQAEKTKHCSLNTKILKIFQIERLSK
jgi:hypothetical protein